MPYTMTADISRMIEAGQKEIFMDNFNAYPIEYTQFTTEKSATKKTETYDSMGNLKAAEEKIEGGSINYGKVTQAYQTSITNKTWANGYEVSLEATKYDLYGCINSIKAKELARTARELEETQAVYYIDNADSVNLADSVPFASLSKPLMDSASLNVSLATAATIADPDNHKTMVNMFYAFKNHTGGPMVARATNGITHFVNQMTVEEVYGSINKAQEMSNTKNVLQKINWCYSTYMSSQTQWGMWDNRYEHMLMQWFMKTQFGNDEDKIYTKNLYFNFISMFNVGCLPNIGFVWNMGA